MMLKRGIALGIALQLALPAGLALLCAEPIEPKVCCGDYCPDRNTEFSCCDSAAPGGQAVVFEQAPQYLAAVDAPVPAVPAVSTTPLSTGDSFTPSHRLKTHSGLSPPAV